MNTPDIKIGRNDKGGIDCLLVFPDKVVELKTGDRESSKFFWELYKMTSQHALDELESTKESSKTFVPAIPQPQMTLSKGGGFKE